MLIMRDNNFFATKNIGVRHENLTDNSFFAPKHSRAARKPGGKLWPAVNDWRTHFALFVHKFFREHQQFCYIEQIVFNNGMQHTDYIPSVTLFPSITSVTTQYFNYVLSGSIICVAQSPLGTNSLAKGRQLVASVHSFNIQVHKCVVSSV